MISYEECKEISKKYSSRNDFCKGNNYAYKISSKNKWLDDFTWLKSKTHLPGYWTYERCEEESRKYTSRNDFCNESRSAYTRSLKNGWLDDFTWLVLKNKPNGYWTYERCYELARNFTSKKKFELASKSAYTISLKNHWMDDFDWFYDYSLLSNDPIDCVYAYVFSEEETIYIGRTVNREGRDNDHKHYEKDPVVKYLLSKNLDIKDNWPKMTILEDNLTVLKGLELEDYYVKLYKEKGWTVLNKAKTGIHSGSTGALGYFKWTQETCLEEAKKYTSRKRFAEGNSSAYNVALTKGWIDSYTWFKNPNFKWDTFEACEQLAKTCTTLKEFRTASSQAYKHSKENGWLEKFSWLTGRFRWTKELVDKEAKKYTSQGEFSDKCWCAFALARKEGWLKEYTWFKPKHRSLNYETCKQEASKYKTKAEFKRNDSWGHEVSRRNGWLNEFFPKDKTNENNSNL